VIRDGLDCDKIQEGYFRSICEGTSGLTPEQESAYRKLWLTGEGTPLQGESIIRDPADFSCIHRGNILRMSKPEICGCDETPIPVFACILNGLCTSHAYGIRRNDGTLAAGNLVPVCLSCADRREPIDATAEQAADRSVGPPT